MRCENFPQEVAGRHVEVQHTLGAPVGGLQPQTRDCLTMVAQYVKIVSGRST